MSYYLSPIGNSQQLDANGAPLSGGKILTYVAGSSSPATTYTDNAGTAQTNPIVLNTFGLPANPVWLQGGLSYKLVFTDADDVVIRTVDDITGINDPALAGASDQWVVFGGAATYINGTSFSVVGDQTPTLQVNRRLKTVNTGGTIYSTITGSVFGAGITTVTVASDSGSLDSGLSQVSYGLLSSINPAIPSGVTLVSGTAFTAAGSSNDWTGIPAWAQRVTISFAGLSTNGTALPAIQLGAGSIETSGYLSSASYTPNAGATVSTNGTSAFPLAPVLSADTVLHGTVTLSHIGSNRWVYSFIGAQSNVAGTFHAGGSKQLAGPLDRVRLTISGGVDVFDAGTVNILWE